MRDFDRYETEFDKNFGKIVRAQKFIVVVGSIVSLAIAGGVIWGIVKIVEAVAG